MCVTIATDLRDGDRALATREVVVLCLGLVEDAVEILDSIVR